MMKKAAKVFCLTIACFVAMGLLSTGAFAAQPAPVVASEVDMQLEGLNPYIYVSDYEIVEGVVETGETFTLRVYITNANPQTHAYNVMMSFYFSGDEGFYIPRGDSNQHYFPVLYAGETTPVDIPLQVKEDFAWPAVVIEFMFNYVNSDRVDHSNNSLITLLQHEKTELAVRLVSLPATAAAGERTPVNVQCSNTGKTDLTNLVTTIEGDFVGSPMTFERETLEAGGRFMVDAQLVFNQPGDTAVSVRVSYENAQGEQFETDTQENEITVVEAAQPPVSSQSDPALPSVNDMFSANSFWFYITVAGGVLLVGVVVALVVNLVRNRNKRK